MGETLQKIMQVAGPVASFLGPVGQVVGAISTVAGTMGSKKKPGMPAPIQPAQAPEFKPVKPTAMGRPDSLSSFAGYAPEQERSALATKGLNKGLGADEESYYRNLVSRSLVGDNNQVVGDANTLLPVESQYFSRGGVNTSDIMQFLKQIQGA